MRLKSLEAQDHNWWSLVYLDSLRSLNVILALIAVPGVFLV